MITTRRPGPYCKPGDPLTDRQAEVFRFVVQHFLDHQYIPTVRGIASHLRITSTNGVMCHLLALEKKGLIALRSSDHRCKHPQHGSRWSPIKLENVSWGLQWDNSPAGIVAQQVLQKGVT